MGLAKVFFWGFLISFLGSLPPGTLNIVAMQISIEDGVKGALMFAVGRFLVEMIYVRISLVGINWVRKQKRLLKYLEWITILIVAAIAVGSFIAAASPQASKNVIFDLNVPKFVLGLILSAVSPVQIPFWFGWSTVLFAKNILKPNNAYYNIYIVGIALGTFLANLIYIYGGQFVGEKLKTNHALLYWIIGGIFAATALFLFVRLMMNKGFAKKLENLET